MHWIGLAALSVGGSDGSASAGGSAAATCAHPRVPLADPEGIAAALRSRGYVIFRCCFAWAAEDWEFGMGR